MIENDRLSRDDVLDALLDLKHDLGKYIRLPVAMLPADAGDADLRQALETALNRTRSGPEGVRSAAELWDGFVEEVGAALDGYSSAAELRRAVEQALAWRAALGDPDAAVDRQAVEADLGAVGVGIQRLIEEVHVADR